MKKDLLVKDKQEFIIEEKGIVHMQKLYEEYLTMINSIERIMENKYESE